MDENAGTAAEEAPVETYEPALAPQEDKLNPSEEIKNAVESATGMGETEGAGTDKSDDTDDGDDTDGDGSRPQ